MKNSSGKWSKPPPLRRRIVIEKADRFHRLSSDPMGELTRVRRRVEKRGVPVIDFAQTAPDLPLPESGEKESGGSLSEQLAAHFQKRRGVTVDPEEELLPLLHMDEGFRLLCLAFVNPGDVVLLPDPADPAYRVATTVAGGWPVTVPLVASRAYLPDLERIEPEASVRAQIFFVSYPNVPTAALADRSFLEGLIRFARKRNVIVAHDASLTGALLDDVSAVGLLDHPVGKEVGVEFHAVAPLHDTGGWRPGYVVGNREIIFAMRTLQAFLGNPAPTLVDAPFRGVLAVGPKETEEAVSIFRRRRQIAVDGLHGLEWNVKSPPAGISLWVRVPHGYHSMSFSSMLLRKAGIAVVPGIVFGEFGHDCVLISLTGEERSIEIALDRLRRVLPDRWRLSGWIRSRKERRG